MHEKKKKSTQTGVSLPHVLHNRQEIQSSSSHAARRDSACAAFDDVTEGAGLPCVAVGVLESVLRVELALDDQLLSLGDVPEFHLARVAKAGRLIRAIFVLREEKKKKKTDRKKVRKCYYDVKREEDRTPCAHAHSLLG